MPEDITNKVVLDRAYAMIESAAVKGERCPLSENIPGRSKAVSTLARAGRIRVEVFRHNFRVVTILEGEHKGKTTKPPEPNRNGHPMKPYCVVSAAGTTWGGHQVDPGSAGHRPEPSKPRSFEKRDGEG